LSINPSTVQSQAQPQGIIVLTSAAPAGGAVVSLATSDAAVARVPLTVTVPAGLTQAAFTVETSTVRSATAVAVTAQYSGSSQTAMLTITPPPLTATFTVTSPTKGADACLMTAGLDELDCILDGTRSSGFVDQYIWTYTVGTNTLGHTVHDPGTKPQTTTKCGFLSTGVGGGSAPDQYLQMEVTLQVMDTAGNRSPIVRRAVRLYPNRQCNFTY
jgi:hypothetical protein